MSAKAPRKKIRWDLWMIVTVGVSIFYMLFLLYPLISMLSKSVIGEDGGFTWQYFAKVFHKKYYQRAIWGSLKISATVTLITVLVSMLSLSLYLTAFAILYVCLMLVVSRKIAGRSGKYFVRQQKSIGDLNGYVEEMINGQRVVKVFCYEERAGKRFDERNDDLRTNAFKAGAFSNMMGPVNNNLG